MSVLSFRQRLHRNNRTFTMDVLAALTIKLRMITPLSPHLIGRWFASVAWESVAFPRAILGCDVYAAVWSIRGA
jgi:hypothetical protein